MSTTSEITPAETNPNDPVSVNRSSQSQPSKTDHQNPKNNETSTPDSISETKENPKQDARTGPSATREQDPKAENEKRAFTFPVFTSRQKKSNVPIQVAVDGHIQEKVDEKAVFSSLITSDVDYIKKISEKLQKYKNIVDGQLKVAETKLEELKKEGDEATDKDYRELKKAVTKLKVHMPTKNKLSEAKDQHHDQQSIGALDAKLLKKIPAKVIEKFPEFHRSNVLKNSRDFLDFEARYKDLSPQLMLCLLCFSVFPDNAIIKKRLMVYWWIAEGFVPPTGVEEDIKNGKTKEDFGNEYFYELMRRGFIEPANKKRTMSLKLCRMHPFIRSALVMIAEKAKFFNFDPKGKPIENFAGSLRACLVGNGLLNYDDLREGRIRVKDLEKLHLVFNVNEHILEFKTDWLLQMKNVNILYLGRWTVLATDHIEVEETDFLEGVKIMKYLKLFSLQGVSRITELPESVSKLSSLEILDVRACHSLETIPKEIGLLKHLTHLDMSDCYLLEHMPKSLAMLSELRVLKGFVVGRNSCTLEDLAKLEKLEKLSIYTRLQEFPAEEDVSTLRTFQALRKLTIAWGGGALHTPKDEGKGKEVDTGTEKPKAEAKPQQKEIPAKEEQKHGKDNRKDKRAAAKSTAKAKTEKQKRPSRSFAFKDKLWKLEKLDLKCFPMTTPAWLTPSNLRGVKKLYIRGGKFSDLGQYQELLDSRNENDQTKGQWEVEILRLKYLNELEMDWRELQGLFPKMIYLEKVGCPKLTFFPCDATGVWIDMKKLKKSDDKFHIFSPSYSY